MSDVVVEIGRIDHAQPRAREALLAREPGMFLDVADPQRVRRAVEQPRVEQFGDVGGRHGSVGDATRGCRHFDQRLEPIGAARSVAHDPDLASARLRAHGKRLRHRIGPQRQRAGIFWDVNGGHDRALHSRASSSNCAGVTRPCKSPLTIIDGAQAQLPRQ